MGRLRANMLQVIGISFDRKLVESRLRLLGISDPATLKSLLDEMEKAQTKEAFLKKITRGKDIEK